MELIFVKVRPSNGDKKMHVLRFLFSSSDEFSVCLINAKLIELFPYGFYKPSIERFMIDYSFDDENKRFVSLCNHDYLAKYLNSEIKIE